MSNDENLKCEDCGGTLVVSEVDDTGRRPFRCDQCSFAAWLDDSGNHVDENGIPYL